MGSDVCQNDVMIQLVRLTAVRGKRAHVLSLCIRESTDSLPGIIKFTMIGSQWPGYCHCLFGGGSKMQHEEMGNVCGCDYLIRGRACVP